MSRTSRNLIANLDGFPGDWCGSCWLRGVAGLIQGLTRMIGTSHLGTWRQGFRDQGLFSANFDNLSNWRVLRVHASLTTPRSSARETSHIPADSLSNSASNKYERLGRMPGYRNSVAASPPMSLPSDDLRSRESVRSRNGTSSFHQGNPIMTSSAHIAVDIFSSSNTS